MVRISPAIFCAAFFGLALTAGQAQAQALFKTFVSKTGNDAGNCDFLTPCLTMARAVSQTNANGMVNCLDSGDYTQTVSITVSLTIDCSGTAATGGPFIINTPGITVVIKNLTIFANSIPAVAFQQGAGLSLEKVRMDNDAMGIYFNPPASAMLQVTDCFIHKSSGAGILIQPSGSGRIKAALNRIQSSENGGAGVSADSTGMTGGRLSVTLRDSMVVGGAGNGVVVSASSLQATAVISMDRSTSANNAGTGLVATGPGSVVVFGSSSINGNNVGMSFSNSGNMVSYGNNSFNDNVGGDGSTSQGVIGLK